MGTVERRFEIMKYLCRVRHATMPSLAQQFGVSVRTIKRDIDELTFIIPLYSMAGRYGGGVYICEDYSMDRAYMSREDINLLENIRERGSNNQQLNLNVDDLARLNKIIRDYSVPSVAV